MLGFAYLKTLPGPRGSRAGWSLMAPLALSLVLAATIPALAQGGQKLDQFSRSYITPFPTGNHYKLAVLGDSLGDGIWAGLYRIFKEDSNIEVVRKSRVSTGFTRVDYFDWNAALGDILKTDTVHIAVIMVGANDLQSIVIDKRWYKPGTDQWRQVYGDRIDRFIKRLKESRVAVYWVGLPIMRGEDHNQGMQVMNEIFREKAFINGVKYIDTWNGFADEFGRYSAYGPDLTGQMRRLRAEDGVHFTMSGYVKLAHFVEREIRRDLRVARAERNIPLAGSEEEQARAVRRTRPAPAAGAVRPAESSAQAASSAPSESLAPTKSVAAGMEIVRPALGETAATIPANYAPPGEVIAHDMSGGLTALATISPMNDSNLLAGSQQLPLAQRPYYRVLIRGEQLKSKPGRADDFSWPPS